jgi:hypothetical protein
MNDEELIKLLDDYFNYNILMSNQQYKAIRKQLKRSKK